jgi:hypothetical protein
MRRWFLVMIVPAVLLSGRRASSQVELFGGYSNLRVSNTPPGMGSSANGWEAGVSAHLIGSLGLELDYSNHYGMTPIFPPNGTMHFVPEFTELYGPRFTPLSLPKIEPFVHALVGSVHGVAGVSPLATERESAFALDFGGGINVKATQHIWIRLIQADYLRFNFTNNSQNDTRISAGLVFRFGSW